MALRAVASSSVAVLGVAATLSLSATAVRAQVSFLSPSYYSAGVRPQAITVGDLDGDGDLDLVTASYMGYLFVKKNNGDGTFFTAQKVVPTESGSFDTTSLAVGDLDGDGDLDLITSNFSGIVSVLKNNGSGTFADARDFSVGQAPIAVTVGDLDEDGDLDIATANLNSNDLSVLKNDGTGTFAAAQSFAVGNEPISITVGDLDGDGDLDLVTSNRGSNYLSVLKNDGNGTFAAQNFTGRGNVTVGDLDGDGDLDIATAAASVLKNNGDGTFAAPQYFAGGGSSIALGDLDGDGDLDIATPFSTSENSSVVSVSRNKGNGTFAAPQTFNIVDTTQALTVGDLDGDGDLDLATASGLFSGFVAVLQNTTPTLQLSLSPDRSNPAPLAGQTVKGNVYVFASGKDADFLRVRFFIDDPDKSGESFRLEQTAPFDLSGSSGSKANPSNSRGLTNGTHTITATFARPDGTYRTVTSTFTVAN